MSTLRTPSLGPIVGHTTDTSCRLWIAASDALDEKGVAEDIRTIGVIGVVGSNGRVAGENIFYFRLRREYHRTGTFNLGVDLNLWRNEAERKQLKPFLLSPATHYRVRMASLNVDDAGSIDDEVPSESVVQRLPAASAWANDLNRTGIDKMYVEAEFTTHASAPAADPSQPLSFLLGSCRYPGLPWQRKDSDAIFGPMLNTQGDVQFVLMVGDQIYADEFNRYVPIGRADSYKEFEERYHTAFGSPNISRLLARKPTYMILDDHEIEDNWTQDRIGKSSKRTLFNWAMGAYMSYQWSHGPRFEDSYVHGRTMTGNDVYLKHQAVNQLFYDFSCANYPFFVLDTRTQRFLDDVPGALTDNHLLGRPSLHPSEPSQLDRLCAWLVHMQKDRGNMPKFIVSSSVFVPNGVDTAGEGERYDRRKNESDAWSAFPSTRSTVLETIGRNGVQNVVFLSGDIHCSNISQLEFSNGVQGIVAYAVTSSAFYWPFSFADGDPAGYVHDSRSAQTPDSFPLKNGPGVMDYRTWAFTQADNFARIDLHPGTAEMLVQFYDADGAPLVTRKQDDSVNDQPQRLKLLPW
ncbi:alkaline phosphatase D family protein [Pseudomonas sp. Fl4BN1]|uniref:alkaline phosphatase D family protein n=1 Tax=Pseudomonas sp. Fl4BN1 TaxID=2697651 RepID=UPI00137814AC|nr:alkaline phosphatase D family protein [Pseudomonas sp. Fl4BN1]NBF12570.1 alkaline phosphatase family protein [Pseudomonas sp. Fl4BN1]